VSIQAGFVPPDFTRFSVTAEVKSFALTKISTLRTSFPDFDKDLFGFTVDFPENSVVVKYADSEQYLRNFKRNELILARHKKGRRYSAPVQCVSVDAFRQFVSKAGLVLDEMTAN
jgi:hypothetical protein